MEKATTNERFSIQGSVSGNSQGLTQRFCIDDRYPGEVEYSQRLGVPAGRTPIRGELDDRTGHYYYRVRFYAAQLGRFCSRDPIAADNNLYRYVFDNPLGATDPTGLADCSKCTNAAKSALLNQIHQAIDQTWIFGSGTIFGGPWQCVRWADTFESNLPPQVAWNPCCTGNGQAHASLGFGHAYYYVTLCDGSIIIVDNGALTGGSHYKVIPPGYWTIPGPDPRGPGHGGPYPGPVRTATPPTASTAGATAST